VSALIRTIGKWKRLIVGAIHLYVGCIDVRLKTVAPVLVGKWNEVDLELTSDVAYNDTFIVDVSVDPECDVALRTAECSFCDGYAIFSMRIRPNRLDVISVALSVEGQSFLCRVQAILPNPFVVGRSIDGNLGVFVGRKDALSRLASNLVQPNANHTLVVGRRRIGKTSLLRQLMVMQLGNVTTVRATTETLGSRREEVLSTILSALEKEVLARRDSSRVLVPSENTGQWNDRFRERFATLLNSHPKYVALFLDEANAISNWDLDAQTMFRSILDDFPRLRVVLAGTPDIVERVTGSSSSPLFGMFSTVRLGPLDRSETKCLLGDTLRTLDIEFPDDLIEEACEYTGGAPLYVQHVGYELVEEYARTRGVWDPRLAFQSVLERTRTAAEVSYRSSVQQLPDELRHALQVLASGGAITSHCGRWLQHLGFVEENEGGNGWSILARLEVELLRTWVFGTVQSASDSATLMFTGPIGEVIMSKEGNVFRTNQAGIVAGNVGTLSDVHVTQSVAPQSSTSLEELARELDQLHTEAKFRASTPEAVIETSIVALARDAAVEGDRSKVAVALSKFGQWTLTLAAELGKTAVKAAVEKMLK
jgi:hypothetical protein